MSDLDQKEVQKSFEQVDNDGEGVAESLSQLLDTLADENQVILFSELSEREIKHLSVIATVGENDALTQTFIDNYMKMKVSKNRKGRKELSEISEAFAGVFQTDNVGKLEGIKNKLGGVL